MIFVEMYGRLGNQFFRYAAARVLQLKFYPNEELVFSFQQINDAAKTDKSFYNVLDDYCIAPYRNYSKRGKVIFNETNILQKLICVPYYFGLRKIRTEDMNEEIAFERKWVKKLCTNGIYWFRMGDWPLEKTNQRNKFLSGNFESANYFNDYREVLLKEFTPKHKILKKNKGLYEKILTTNSVCLSVRRGDFESNEAVSGLHSVCHKEYFINAIEMMKASTENPVFFFFSDDIEWVKENICTGCETYCEDGTDPVWEKLRMMSSCKHFILSNSTFSWWAQYLSTSENKIVISPSRWYNNDFDSPLIDRRFIKIGI